MLSIQNLRVEFSAKALFDDVNFVVNKTDRIALVGKNGAGKSTLLKILAGQQRPTSGNVAIPDGVTVGYLPQQMQPADDTTVIDEVRKVFASHDALQAEIDKVVAELAERTDYESESYMSLISRLDFLHERAALSSTSGLEAEIERTLTGLGFARDDFSRPTSEFSGGWRMRIELAKILLSSPDVLLLDEPTNHLDIESIQWLERFLARSGAAVILVSHDKAFIDNVTNRTIEISCGKIYDYKVNYSHYLELRKERLEQQKRAYENQQKEIAEIKDFIERFRYKPTKSNQVQSRIKMLEKIVPIEIDEVDNTRLSLKFPPAARSGDFPIIAEDVAKSYGDHLVFSNVNFTIRRGEKVAFVGKNGEGKSTLVKAIMGEIPYTGTLKIGHNVEIGYFAQNQAQLLDGKLTVFDTIDHVATGDMRLRIRDILGAFMFGGEASDKSVSVLSGGEKTRLAMIKLLLEPVNFLILDEPTNHLDIKTKEILKEAVKAFDGTVIVVSHDRDFLDGLVEKVYEFGGGKVKEFLGGIYDYLNSRNLSSLNELNLSISPTAALIADVSQQESSSGKQAYLENRERERQLKRKQKAVEKAEEEVGKFESEIAALEADIASGATDADTLKKYDDARKNLQDAMNRWEELQLELEDN